jgi:hypothetical protein
MGMSLAYDKRFISKIVPQKKTKVSFNTGSLPDTSPKKPGTGFYKIPCASGYKPLVTTLHSGQT